MANCDGKDMRPTIVSDIKYTALQDGDCSQKDNAMQELVVRSESNGCQNFIIIQTKRWAIDGDKKSIKELCDMIGKMCEKCTEAEILR